MENRFFQWKCKKDPGPGNFSGKIDFNMSKIMYPQINPMDETARRIDWDNAPNSETLGTSRPLKAVAGALIRTLFSCESTKRE